MILAADMRFYYETRELQAPVRIIEDRVHLGSSAVVVGRGIPGRTGKRSLLLRLPSKSFSSPKVEDGR